MADPTFKQASEAIKTALKKVYGMPENGMPDTLNFGQLVPWGDVRIYTPQEWYDRGERYGVGRDVVANLIFEGPVYEAMNYGGRFYEVLRRELNKVGCWFELGNAWNLAVISKEPLTRPFEPNPAPRQETYNGHKVYDDAGLQAIEPALIPARDLWRRRGDEYLAQHGDKGSCVIGAGIAVYHQFPDEYPQSLLVINAPGGQGSLTWETSVKEVLAGLTIAGVDAFYECGVMD